MKSIHKMEKPVEERAVDLFRGGCNCAQAVLLAFKERCGIAEEMAMGVAAPFGGGLGRQREVCGSISGMSMAFGLIAKREALVEPAQIYTTTKQLCDNFKEIYGSIVCRELLEKSKDKNFPQSPYSYYATKPCEKRVEDCARVLNNFLNSIEQE